MLKWPPRILIAADVALIIVLTTLLLRTLLVPDIFGYADQRGNYYELATIPGQVRVSHVTGWKLPRPLTWYGPKPPFGTPAFGHQMINDWAIPGWGHQTGSIIAWSNPKPVGVLKRGSTLVKFNTYAISLTVPILVASAWPAWVACSALLARRRGAARRVKGLCANCGYDLRAGGDICPECGRPASPASANGALAT